VDNKFGKRKLFYKPFELAKSKFLSYFFSFIFQQQIKQFSTMRGGKQKKYTINFEIIYSYIIFAQS